MIKTKNGFFGLFDRLSWFGGVQRQVQMENKGEYLLFEVREYVGDTDQEVTVKEQRITESPFTFEEIGQFFFEWKDKKVAEEKARKEYEERYKLFNFFIQFMDKCDTQSNGKLRLKGFCYGSVSKIYYVENKTTGVLYDIPNEFHEAGNEKIEELMIDWVNGYS